MKIVITMVLTVLAVLSNAATPYYTLRLEKIAKAVHLNLKDTLVPGTVIDSVAVWEGKDIHVRTNALGDVEHIGYNLFAQALKDANKNSQVFDFLERYLLELDLQLDERAMSVRMDADQVVMVEGNVNMLRQLTPHTNLQFSIDVMPRKMYRVAFMFDKKKVRISFPSTHELLIGADMLELETIFKRDVQRMLSIPSDAVINDWSNAVVHRSQHSLIVDGGMYLSKMIRGDIYLTETSNGRVLLCDRKNATQSVRNVMLTGSFVRDIPLKLEIDRYGNIKDSLDITLQQFIAYCKAEGCKLYFGIKTKSEDQITGTLFAYNEKNSYDHMLTLVFPLSILEGSLEPIRGKVYTYIPLHFVPDQYFKIYQEPISD